MMASDVPFPETNENALTGLKELASATSLHGARLGFEKLP
eukprot:CAMPEP_0179896836 /NCGR_PEP_ID=MMETSP0982-20121206/36639_1 /TAXON_ID=483367 /ORGANISM="non described non described, Strain CCMP 2436" /LENGTH=39 /DNA_ID= /DNA_START= /DNA_END= /DNA_ORIENTATION=